MTLDQDSYLAHYGVKGMKWGVRRSRGSSSSGKKNRRALIQINVTKKEKKQKRSNGIKELSDQELLAKVNRLNLEKRYRDLSAPQKSAGKAFVSDVITNSGKEVAKKYVTKGMDAAVEALIKKAKTSTAKK